MNHPDVALLVALTALLVAGAAWLLHSRARWQLERRMEARRQQMSQLIEHAQCVLWEAEVVIETGAWEWHLKLHPSAFCRQLFGGRIPGPRDDLWAEFRVEHRQGMDQRARAAIEGGRPGYEQEFKAEREGRVFWLHENVSITPVDRDRYWLVGLVTDITAQREAEEARRQSELTVERILTHADCLLWRAFVVRSPEGGLSWIHFDIPRSQLSDLLFGDRIYQRERGFWATIELPEQADMDRRSAASILGGLPAYEQRFRAITKAGRLFWLHERVSITRLEDGRWSLVGVITDHTAQHEAEEALHQSETRLAHLLERADSTIWQARVKRDAGGVLRWEMFIPRSQLYRRIFGLDPNQPIGFEWKERGVPEADDMERRAHDAITRGVSGYDQVFHARGPEGDIWLSESASIMATGPDAWDLVGVISDITAQRRAEEAQRQSEVRLATLLEQADCMIWQGEVRRRGPDDYDWELFTPRSQLFRRIFGRDPEGVCHFDWSSGRVPEFPEMRARSRRALAENLPGYEHGFHYQHPDLGDIWLNEKVTVKPAGPDHWELVGIITDITAQRQLEAARQATEKRLQDLLARADCLLWEATAELGEGDWQWQFSIQPSLLCQKLYGRASPQASQGLWRNFDIPERQEMDARCRAAVREGRAGYDQVFHIVRPDGSTVWISENVTIRPLGLNRYSLVGVAVDISAQMRAEEALASEKERLAVTLRAMHESVITTDTAGNIQFMNPAAAELTGWAVGEGAGQAVEAVLRLESNRTDQPVPVPYAQVARGGVVADLPGQTRLVSRGGQRRQVEGCCAPIHSADSRVTGMVLVLRDVTEQDRLEQELMRATRLESVGVLAGGIAHDFNNILTAVMGNLALAQLELTPDSPAAGSLRSAEKAALRARDLTQQLLTFAKGGEPVRAAVQLEAVVREMTAFALHGSQVKAHYDLAPGLWPADADKGQVGRVVQNLVINAVQAMPHGGSLRIVARNDPVDGLGQPGLAAGNYLQIAITDTGTGIKPADLGRIFDPYFTTKQTGTGLGLAAVYSIIKKHRGHIEVESRVGQGSTFRFWLPALHGQVAAHETRAPWSDLGAMKGRVLFMDDEQIIRDMAVALLKRFGLEVDCAVDGAEAVEKYRAALAGGRRYDLVITDLTVPGGMGGLAALGQLKQLDPAVRAVVSSGYSSDPVLANYREHGFMAVIAKPYEMSAIARVVRELLPEA